MRTFTVEELIKAGVVAPPMDGNHGEIHPKAADFVKVGVPFIMASDMKNGRVDSRACAFISEAQASSLRKGFAKEGDVLLSHKATLGRTAIVESTVHKYLVLTPQVTYYRVLDPTKLDNRYLKYYFDSAPFQQTFAAWAGAGSTRAYIGITAQRKLPIVLPSISVQNAVATAIGALDDRINLLRETITTLEAIAQALFKSWFVDFDPVRAKMEGRIPQGMDEATAALFPDGLEERQAREVPHGWYVEKFEVMCSYLNRGLSPKYVDEGGVLVLNQKCVRDFAVDFTKGRRHDPAQRKIDGRELIVGDVLVNSTGVGTLGRVAQLLHVPERCIADSHVTVIRAGPLLTWSYLGQLLKQMQPEIEAMGEGSTGQTELSRSKLGDLPILVPSPEVLARFDAAVLPLKQRVSIQTQQAQTLVALRDTLLPRLISGQLRLPEVRRASTEVVAV
ncbi:restriction endonuclease subunit S [Variovorax sp. ZS18.2.2]|uniref:restriction endonuclease subunit S n=1 Tax=Variovorax sp. ZS18.2.2 TaxID=2971255 RepID=UPI002150ED71|nr:restriction endonuclease subunit S [Variovorax sp. ZS18.2.2]MCR6480763.1 restriction endonuclease subunit S [Variovorax sp. ZS18.2.2]